LVPYSPLGGSAQLMLDTASRVSEEAKAEALEPDQPAPEAADAPEPAAAERVELFTPEVVALLWKVVPAAWLLGVFVAGFMAGVQLAFLVLAAGVLVLVIALMWSSVQSLTGGAPLGFEEALGMGAPSKVEEEKRAVLRALKDLDFERGVGKISPEDYAELSAKYRAEAKRLIQRVDETLGPAREEAERAIERRLARAGLSAADADAQPEPEPEKPAEIAQKPSETHGEEP
jgi:hypothetical protein